MRFATATLCKKYLITPPAFSTDFGKFKNFSTTKHAVKTIFMK